MGLTPTVVSVGVVAAFGSMVLYKKSKFEKAARGPGQDKLGKEGDKYVLITNIMAGVTGVAAITSIMLAYRDWKGFKKKRKNSNIKLTTGASELGIGIEVSF